jgi:hypothetical protein
MAQNMEDLNRMTQTGVDGALRMWSGWAKSWQAVGAEMNDYAKRSFEDSSKTLEKLMTARTIEQAVEIQSSYVKRSYEDYVAQMNRLGTMYADLAKDTAKPFDAVTMPKR